jgi:predicted N-acetyltransferase YhbS
MTALRGEVEISTPTEDRQWAELDAFFEKVFGPGDARLWRAFQGRPPFCRREWCRIIRLDGQIVSHVCFVPRLMRIGASVIRAGTIGYMATHLAYRGRGLASALMNYWTKEAIAQGYHLSYIHGIPDFYERFGYRYAFFGDIRDAAIRLDLVDRPIPETGLRIRAYQERDLPAVMRLYEEDNRTRSGSLVRSEAYWQWLLSGLEGRGWVRQGDMVVVEEGGGREMGYAMINPDDQGRFMLWEVSAQGRNVMDALLGELIRRAQRAGVDRLYFRAPLDHPFVAFCISLGAQVAGYSCDVYGRLLDVAGLFRAIGPELEARLARSSLQGWVGTLRLETDTGTVALPFVKGKLQPDGMPPPVRTARMPQSWLVRLVTGYSDVAALSGRRGIEIARTDWPLLRALFPRGCPYIWAADSGY